MLLLKNDVYTILESHEHYTVEAVFGKLVTLGWQNRHESLEKLGNGAKASVYRISKPDMVVRIPNEDNSEDDLRSEKYRQESFFYGLQMGKANGQVPEHIHIPFIWNDNHVNSNLPEWVVIMEHIRGKTLLFYKISEILRKSNAITEESELDGMTDKEIIAKYPEIEKKLNIYDYRNAIRDILGEEEKANFDKTLLFLNSHGLSHQDIHLGNIMIQKVAGGRAKIFLIDFGNSIITAKSHSTVHEGRRIYQNGLENSTKTIEFIP